MIASNKSTEKAIRYSSEAARAVIHTKPSCLALQTVYRTELLSRRSAEQASEQVNPPVRLADKSNRLLLALIEGGGREEGGKAQQTHVSHTKNITQYIGTPSILSSHSSTSFMSRHFREWRGGRSPKQNCPCRKREGRRHARTD